MIYQLYIRLGHNTSDAAMTVDVVPAVSFLFDPANTDYAKFKADILESKAELQDAEGNTMTAQDAQAFVATLP